MAMKQKFHFPRQSPPFPMPLKNYGCPGKSTPAVQKCGYPGQKPLTAECGSAAALRFVLSHFQCWRKLAVLIHRGKNCILEKTRSQREQKIGNGSPPVPATSRADQPPPPFSVGAISSSSQLRQNFFEDEAVLNCRSTFHLQTSYLSLGFKFGTMSPCIVSHFFRELSRVKLEGAEHLKKLQNQHESRVLLQAVQKPALDEWHCSLYLMEAAPNLEKGLNQALLKLQALNWNQRDSQPCDFLESPYLCEEVKLMKHLTTLRHVQADPGLGDHLVERLNLKQH
ncbi:LOW QUALITY PROTEIN: ferritin light chain-like [Antechinus flavipes]|uniref:LOW QUALITY PROTEIN: ferritin light chain-like n=1 Tax=Antechinus flavipes TaxID=38775 RepID=UPI00223666FB|nr:LOW QUALITY PROTEIN: ferritin light chain-like [Antechinus flavipes]